MVSDDNDMVLGLDDCLAVGQDHAVLSDDDAYDRTLFELVN